MAELRVGIVGCGRMGRERARCAQASGAHVAAVWDPDTHRAGALATQYGAAVLEVEDFAGCDAIFLCTPPDARPALAMWAVDSRLPFFAEKPLTVDHIAAEPVLRALERAPVINAVGYMNRWRASVQYARQALSGRTLLGMTAHWVNRGYGVPWWLDERASGGPYNEQATHVFDLARHLCGEIDDVAAMGASPPAGGALPLSVATSLRFASGALGTFLYSCQSTAKEIGARVFTTEGSLAFSGWDFRLVENTIDGTIPALAAEDVFLVETRAFLDSVRTGIPEPALADWADAAQTQQVVDAARSSMNVSLQKGAVIAS